MSGELDGTLELHTVGYCVTFQLSSRPLNSSVRCFASCYMGNLPSLLFLFFFSLRLRLGWGYSLRLLSSTTYTYIYIDSTRFFLPVFMQPSGIKESGCKTQVPAKTKKKKENLSKNNKEMKNESEII